MGFGAITKYAPAPLDSFLQKTTDSDLTKVKKWDSAVDSCSAHFDHEHVSPPSAD